MWERYCNASPKPEFFFFLLLFILSFISQLIWVRLGWNFHRWFSIQKQINLYNSSFLFLVLHKPTPAAAPGGVAGGGGSCPLWFLIPPPPLPPPPPPRFYYYFFVVVACHVISVGHGHVVPVPHYEMCVEIFWKSEKKSVGAPFPPPPPAEQLFQGWRKILWLAQQ